MSFYTQSQATAQSLLRRYGQPVPIRRFTSNFDPVTGASTASTKVSDTLVAVSIPFSYNNAERLNDKLQEALSLGKLRKLICGVKNSAGQTLLYAPEPGDVVNVDSDTFYIRGVSPLSPGGMPVLYTLIAEKGSLSTADAAATESGAGTLFDSLVGLFDSLAGPFDSL